MRLHFKSTLLPKLFTVLIMALSIKLVMGIVALFLPKTGVDFHSSDTFVVRHFYRFDDALIPKAQQKSTQTKTATQEKVKNYVTLDSWHLQALYSEGNEGFIVVIIKNQTHYLDIKQSLEGYTLIGIQERHAILSKENKEYILKMRADDDALPYATNAPQAKAAKSSSEDINEMGVDFNELKEGIVQRNNIEAYMQNPNKIWESIKIHPVNNNGKIEGFAVRYVKKDSVFEALGVRPNDIIIEANGVVLDSIAKAESLYKHIDEIDNVALVVLRNGVREEMVYEIR